jgi:ZIP family zinc transporter
MGFWSWMPAAVGFVLGQGFCVCGPYPASPASHAPTSERKSISTTWRRSRSAGHGHHPAQYSEGLAVGVAFGAVAADLPSASLGAAVALAIGIGIQNFPEGTAVSVPLAAGRI